MVFLKMLPLYFFRIFFSGNLLPRIRHTHINMQRLPHNEVQCHKCSVCKVPAPCRVFMKAAVATNGYNENTSKLTKYAKYYMTVFI